MGMRRRASASLWTASGTPALLAAEQHGVVGPERKAGVGDVGMRGEEQQARAAGQLRCLESRKARVPLDLDMGEVVECRALEGTICHVEARRPDQVHRHPETGRQSQDRPSVLWNVRLVEGEAHGLRLCRSPTKAKRRAQFITSRQGAGSLAWLGGPGAMRQIALGRTEVTALCAL